jgi:hypothetical protein
VADGPLVAGVVGTLKLVASPPSALVGVSEDAPSPGAQTQVEGDSAALGACEVGGHRTHRRGRG